MLRINPFIASAALLLLCGKALASDRHLDVSFGAQTYWYSYDEPSVMEQDGFMYGGVYSLIYGDFWVVGVDGMVATGQVDYDSDDSGTMSGQDNFMTDTRLLLGASETNLKQTMSGILYTGLGYRYLSNESADRYTSTGDEGYDRRSHYLYTPIGYNLTLDKLENWRSTIKMEYDYLWQGIQKSNLSSVDGYDNITNTQYSGYGYRFSVSFERRLIFNSWIAIEPFYRHWDIAKSDTVTDSSDNSWVEPANDTNEFGVNITLNF
jgi:hypothetical protein